MPITVQIDGKDTTVFTQDELNSAAKSARLEAETATKAKYDPQVADLTTKATLADQLQSQLANVTKERDTFRSERDGLAKTSALGKAFKAKGLTDPVIEIALGHKGADALDPANDAALDAFLTPFKSLTAATTPPPPPDPKAAGAGGSPTGDVTVPRTAEEIEAQVKANPAWLDDPKNWQIAQQALASNT